MQPGVAPDLVPLPGNWQQEAILIIMDFLAENSFAKGLRALEEETGLRTCRYSEEIGFLRELIMEGDLASAESFIAPLKTRPGFDFNNVIFALRKQDFLECLVSKGDEQVRVDALVAKLKALEGVCSEAELNELCYCMTLTSLQAHPAYAKWSAYVGRMNTFTTVHKALSHLYPSPVEDGFEAGHTSPSPKRLEVLLRRAATFQLHAAPTQSPGIGHAAPPASNGLPPGFTLLQDSLSPESARTPPGPPRFGNEVLSQSTSVGLKPTSRPSTARPPSDEPSLANPSPPAPALLFATVNPRLGQSPFAAIAPAMADMGLSSKKQQHPPNERPASSVRPSAASSAGADQPTLAASSAALPPSPPPQPSPVEHFTDGLLGPNEGLRDAHGTPLAPPASSSPGPGRGDRPLPSPSRASPHVSKELSSPPSSVARPPPSSDLASSRGHAVPTAIAPNDPDGMARSYDLKTPTKVSPLAAPPPPALSPAAGAASQAGGPPASPSLQQTPGADAKWSAGVPAAHLGAPASPPGAALQPPRPPSPTSPAHAAAGRTPDAARPPSRGAPTPTPGGGSHPPEAEAAGEARSRAAHAAALHAYESFDAGAELVTVDAAREAAAIRAIGFSPWMNLLAVGSNAKVLQVLGLPSWPAGGLRTPSPAALPPARPLLRLPDHHLGSIFCTAWGGHGELLATGSNDQVVKVVRLHWKGTGSTVGARGSTVGALWQYAAPDSLDAAADAIQPVPVAELPGHDGTVRALAFCGEGPMLLSGGGGDCAVRVWDVSRGAGQALLHLAGHSDTVVAVHTPRGASAGAAGDTAAFSLGGDGHVIMWDLRAGTAVHRMLVAPTSGPAAAALALSPAGPQLAVGFADGSCRVLDRRQGTLTPLLSTSHHSGECRTVDFDPTGRHLVTASFDGSLGVVDLALGRAAGVWRRHSEKVVTAAWCPHTPGLASCGTDKTVKLWLPLAPGAGR